MSDQPRLCWEARVAIAVGLAMLALVIAVNACFSAIAYGVRELRAARMRAAKRAVWEVARDLEAGEPPPIPETKQ